MRIVSADSFAQWRDAARALLGAGVAPHEVSWQAAHADSLFGDDAGGEPTRQDLPAGAPLSLPASLLKMLEEAAAFRDGERWAFLYRVLWRWRQGDCAVLSPADADGARLAAMVKAVRREMHHMHAFLRFRERPQALGAPRFVAWYEPEHDILALGAAHFMHRMGRASWLIATPAGSAASDGEHLRFGAAPATRPQRPDDVTEALWLTYYRSICNPARLNTAAMEMHMPVRYWKNLPEAALIPNLVSRAATGARRIAQAGEVGQREGAQVRVDAARAQPLRELPSALDACRNCDLWRHATQAVPGAGPESARLMIVGEQPGDAEDIAGLAFVGPAGRLLGTAMNEAGVSRDAAWMTNAVKHFKFEPRGKRRIHKTPAQAEVDACGHWLRAEIAAVKPRVILALGATATRAVLGGAPASMANMQGRAIAQGDLIVIPAWHPSYVLRLAEPQAQEAARRELVAALRLAKMLSDQRETDAMN
ncbi:UdgX family uracil-DNA binding protein [Noviherbaspirillum pedocola]|uniref:Type-4 uracil-DNA glycosylase n=1 Tax=Noviherbaspirillum pedocola TaxID=2801341 RepID=A0A934SR99_9BURK|nr:UdgX family uracil-DNA binding protein [Noviherbaspirillum pedocola]MBK4734029.1 UdgX family uracil-DNA binding protein [Noviherbaspirillum pedocola]